MDFVGRYPVNFTCISCLNKRCSCKSITYNTKKLILLSRFVLISGTQSVWCPKSTYSSLNSPIIVSRLRINCQEKSFLISGYSFYPNDSVSGELATVARFPNWLPTPTEQKSICVGIGLKSYPSFLTIAETGSVGLPFAAFFQSFITRSTVSSMVEREMPSVSVISENDCLSKYRSIIFLSFASGRQFINASKLRAIGNNHLRTRSHVFWTDPEFCSLSASEVITSAIFLGFSPIVHFSDYAPHLFGDKVMIGFIYNHENYHENLGWIPTRYIYFFKKCVYSYKICFFGVWD